MAKKILIVDDELHLVHILTFKLQQAGYHVFSAHNGHDGYELACQQKPDLIVTDYQMPVMDGFEMAVRLRANASTEQIPVIMLTARGHKIPPSDLAKTNVKIMMAKPFSALELAENVSDLLGPNSELSADRVRDHGGGGHAA